MSRKVQIPAALFSQMVLYIMDHKDPSDLMYQEILRGIEQKMDSIHRHNLYTAYKTEHNLEKKEQARKEYLDSAGIPSSFRWEEYTSSGGEQL